MLNQSSEYHNYWLIKMMAAGLEKMKSPRNSMNYVGFKWSE